MIKPSDVAVIVPMPFVGTFKKCEAEHVAAVIVLYAKEHGDSFEQRFDFAEIGTWFTADVARCKWFPPFLDPRNGIAHLAKEGWLVGKPGDFTVSESFLERLQRWVPAPKAAEESRRGDRGRESGSDNPLDDFPWDQK